MEAKKIIEEANAQAEKISKEASQKSLAAYNTVYNKILKKGEKEAVKLKIKNEQDTKHELEKTKSKSEKTAKEIEVKSKRNFEKAVDYVFNSVIGEI